jgi:hypothetical protein
VHPPSSSTTRIAGGAARLATVSVTIGSNAGGTMTAAAWVSPR